MDANKLTAVIGFLMLVSGLHKEATAVDDKPDLMLVTTPAVYRQASPPVPSYAVWYRRVAAQPGTTAVVAISQSPAIVAECRRECRERGWEFYATDRRFRLLGPGVYRAVADGRELRLRTPCENPNCGCDPCECGAECRCGEFGRVTPTYVNLRQPANDVSSPVEAPRIVYESRPPLTVLPTYQPPSAAPVTSYAPTQAISYSSGVCVGGNCPGGQCGH